MKYHFYFLLFIFLQNPSFGQDNSSVFYEFVIDDSLMMFYNRQHRFVEKKCADFIRYTRVDVDGNFNGYYKDVSNENVLMSNGYYDHGRKHGYFEIFYPDGKIKCKGNFIDNKPVGQWDYFYENGLPERTIRITDVDTLLIRLVDREGNLKVIEGNGEFNGFVEGNSRGYLTIMANGRVENGKPNGKWKSTMTNNNVYCKEEFEDGKLVRGVFPRATSGAGRVYTNRSFLNTFFLGSYLTILEEFRFDKCADIPMRSPSYSPKNYSFDMQKFSSDLRVKIDNVIEEDIRIRKTNDYSIGDSYLTIQFSIDENGKPKDFKLLTAWGQQFFHTISSSIRVQTTFPPYPKTMFFHLKLHIPGGSIYQWNFQFSKNQTL